MNDDDNQLLRALLGQPGDTLVAVGTKALVVRSGTLVRRGLALANSLPGRESGLATEPQDLIGKTYQAAQSATEEALSEAHTSVSDGTSGDAIRLQPNSAVAHYKLGLELYGKGDLDGAVAEFRTTIRLQPDWVDAHLGLGASLFQQGDLDGAIAECRTAIRLQPDSPDAHSGLGASLCRQYDLDWAIAECRTAIRLQPNHAAAHHNLGVALLLKGDRLGALDEIRNARELDPKDPVIAETYDGLRRELESR
jgi:Flp pilus assembly protein TadD